MNFLDTSTSSETILSNPGIMDTYMKSNSATKIVRAYISDVYGPPAHFIKSVELKKGRRYLGRVRITATKEADLPNFVARLNTHLFLIDLSQ